MNKCTRFPLYRIYLMIGPAESRPNREWDPESPFAETE